MSAKLKGYRSKDVPASARAIIPVYVRQEVLRKSRRRCCVCFGLEGDLGVKEGQFAHLDRNRTNSKPDNLAFLCQPCHTQYDKKTNRILGFTPEEVRHYRDLLYAKLGDGSIEWTLRLRIHRTRYRDAHMAIEKAKALLLALSHDVTVQERPVD